MRMKENENDTMVSSSSFRFAEHIFMNPYRASQTIESSLSLPKMDFFQSLAKMLPFILVKDIKHIAVHHNLLEYIYSNPLFKFERDVDLIKSGIIGSVFGIPLALQPKRIDYEHNENIICVEYNDGEIKLILV